MDCKSVCHFAKNECGTSVARRWFFHLDQDEEQFSDRPINENANDFLCRLLANTLEKNGMTWIG